MNHESLNRRDALRLLALAAAAGAIPQSLQAAETNASAKVEKPLHVHPQQQLRMGSEEIAILVYPEFTALDALGPHYFSRA